VCRQGLPFEERGGRLRGALDLIAGRYPRFLFGGDVGHLLPVFHFHESTPSTLEPAFAYLADNGLSRRRVDDAAALARERQTSGCKRAVMLAFDDAWASLWLVRRAAASESTACAPWPTRFLARVADAPAVRPTLDDGQSMQRPPIARPNPFATWPE
jgi:hypothetical protein